MMAQRVRREGSEGAERSRGDLGRCGQRGVLASARGLHSRSAKIAREPAVLDGSLVDSADYMRWELFGWQMGKTTGLVTNATPRLSSRQEVQLPHRVWADGSKGPAKLHEVDN